MGYPMSTLRKNHDPSGKHLHIYEGFPDGAFVHYHLNLGRHETTADAGVNRVPRCVPLRPDTIADFWVRWQEATPTTMDPYDEAVGLAAKVEMASFIDSLKPPKKVL